MLHGSKHLLDPCYRPGKCWVLDNPCLFYPHRDPMRQHASPHFSDEQLRLWERLWPKETCHKALNQCLTKPQVQAPSPTMPGSSRKQRHREPGLPEWHASSWKPRIKSKPLPPVCSPATRTQLDLTLFEELEGGHGFHGQIHPHDRKDPHLHPAFCVEVGRGRICIALAPFKWMH